jgi:hypothetical protein
VNRKYWLEGLPRSIVCALFLMSHAAPALAVTDEERAGARAAADAGATAMDQQRWADAITYFQKAESLVHAPPHLLNIARSHEKLGQLVEAREAYMKVAREELKADAPKVFRQAQAEARAELDAIEPRVPRVSVVVQGSGDLPVKVHMNGSVVPDGLVGVPRPLNPGSYEFQAFAEGAQSTPSTLMLREGAKETVVLTLQAGTGLTAAPPPVAPQPAPTEQPDAAQEGGGKSGMRIGSYVAFGVGVVGLGVGTAFALSASSKRSEADDICSLEGAFSCPEDKRDEVQQLDDDADSASTMSIVGFAVGGLGIGTGVALFLRSRNKDTQSASVTPFIGLNMAGVRGRF